MTRAEINKAKLKSLGYDVAVKACDIHAAHFKRARAAGDAAMMAKLRPLLDQCGLAAVELRYALPGSFGELSRSPKNH